MARTAATARAGIRFRCFFIVFFLIPQDLRLKFLLPDKIIAAFRQAHMGHNTHLSGVL